MGYRTPQARHPNIFRTRYEQSAGGGESHLGRNRTQTQLGSLSVSLSRTHLSPPS
jgi:hypothetical protein